MGSCLTRICSSGSSNSSKPVAMEDPTPPPPPPPPPPLKKKLIILSTAVSHCDYDDPPQPSKDMILPIKPSSSSPHQPKHRHLSIDHLQIIRDDHIDGQPKLRRCSSLNNLSGSSCTLLEAHNKPEDEHVEGGNEVVTVLGKKMVGGGNPSQMGVLKEEEQPQPSNGEEITLNKSSDLQLQTSIVDSKPDLYYLCYSTGSDLSTSSSVGVITPSLSRDNSSLSSAYQSHSRSCSLSRREAISLSVEDIMMLLETEELDEDDLLSFLSISSSKSSLLSSVVRCGAESVSETASEASSFEFRIRSGSSTPPTPCMFKQRINIHYPPPHLLTLTPDEMAEIWGVFEARNAFSSSSSSSSTSSSFSSSSVSTPAVIITNACS